MVPLNDYGEKDWEILWRQLEQEGNIGIDYVINPYLYGEIAAFLRDSPRSRVLDFGAGTNILGIQFFYGYRPAIPGLRTIQDLQRIRENIESFTGLEGSADLVEKGKNYLKDLGEPSNIAIEHFEIRSGNRATFDDGTVALAVSRNFLMHLNLEDLDYHMGEVSRMLSNDGSYVFAILNPAYEKKKYNALHPESAPLDADAKYSFSHGSKGEHGTFHHYWRSRESYEKIFAKYFSISSRIPCVPLSNDFETDYPRYYQRDVPMAFVYRLDKR